ncbi:MAG TPA: Xaa-Pro peptidase family protein [Vicinamibacterales bacterium]|nr:Xaa-Pro peptidase family protein [Vicinamibacterales bacterium]
MQLAPPDHHLARHARLRDDLRAESLDALLVTSLPNVAYLTGLFATAGAAVVARDGVSLVVDGRYAAAGRARQNELGLNLVRLPPSGSYDEAIAAILGTFGNGRVGFEAAHMTVRQHRDLLARLAAGDCKTEMIPTEGLVERRRAVKDAWELQVLHEAGRRLSDAAKCIIPKALAGQRERQVAACIDAELRRVGFDKPAFDTIVAAGPNAAMPHYRAGDAQLANGQLVILDFGGMFNGYAVDMTRTIAVGAADTRQRRLLAHVAEAQSAAFGAIRVGRPATDVDRAARDVLEREGLGDAFSHGTGHGLGLEVHERPRVAKYRPELPAEPLQAGMVFTLEPGAYIEGWGGVRIEDDVVVTPGGAEWLTDVPRLYE